MKKTRLTERFQQLAGIKSLYTEHLDESATQYLSIINSLYPGKSWTELTPDERFEVRSKYEDFNEGIGDEELEGDEDETGYSYKKMAKQGLGIKPDLANESMSNADIMALEDMLKLYSREKIKTTVDILVGDKSAVGGQDLSGRTLYPD